MFNSKSKNQAPIATYDTEAEKVVTLIGPGALCDGPFSARDTTRVDGTINGPVHIDGSLIVGQSGKITGTIVAQNVFLAGEINGTVNCQAGKLEISDTGKLIGDVNTRSLVIDENAIFQGNCSMNVEATSAEKAKKRAEKAVSTNDNNNESTEDTNSSFENN